MEEDKTIESLDEHDNERSEEVSNTEFRQYRIEKYRDELNKGFQLMLFMALLFLMALSAFFYFQREAFVAFLAPIQFFVPFVISIPYFYLSIKYIDVSGEKPQKQDTARRIFSNLRTFVIITVAIVFLLFSRLGIDIDVHNLLKNGGLGVFIFLTPFLVSRTRSGRDLSKRGFSKIFSRIRSKQDLSKREIMVSKMWDQLSTLCMFVFLGTIFLFWGLIPLDIVPDFFKKDRVLFERILLAIALACVLLIFNWQKNHLKKIKELYRENGDHSLD